MAKGKKTGGRDIQPGEVRNPNGRPKVPEYLKKAKKMNKVLLDKYLNKYINMNMTGLRRALEDSKKVTSEVSAMEVMIIRVVMEAVRKGDHKILDFVLNRTVGKVKEEFHVEGSPYSGLMELIKDRRKESDE